MQGDLRVVALLALALAGGCRSKERAPDVVAGADAAAATNAVPLDAAQDAPTKIALRGLLDAAIAASDVGGNDAAACLARERYLALRRAAAAAIPAVRHVSPRPLEVVVGPLVLADEGAGALGELDLAMGKDDCAGERASLYQIVQAFRVVRATLPKQLPRRAILRGLSQASYDLGAEALESTPGTPAEPDAVLADLRGRLEGIRAVVAALAEEVGTVDARAKHAEVEAIASPLAATLDALPSSHAPFPSGGRGAFVLATGRLGDAVRAFGKAIGAEVPPPYRTLVPGATPNALVLPAPSLATTPARVELGRALFYDRRLSKGSVRSCASCHDPSRAFGDGRPTPSSIDPATKLVRNTPTLLYAPLQAVLHWDGRVRTADAQALLPIHARAEMGLASGELLAVIRKDAALVAKFDEAFDDGVTEANVGRALAAYEASTLVPGRAPIDRFALGDETALDAEMRLGLEVFAGKGRCARCHVPPVFGGSRPPDFTTASYAVLGVPVRPGAKELDPDLGRGAITGAAADAHAFRTPTVRAIAKSAPYFHHGAYPTLEAVIELYERGGGRGLGLDVPNQDPDVRPLELTDAERRALLRFLREALDEP